MDLSAGELRKDGVRIHLQEQPFLILVALLENPGEVVTREDLIGRLWADGTVVDFDRGLNAAVARLRQALSDSAEAPRYVETVSRRGEDTNVWRLDIKHGEPEKSLIASTARDQDARYSPDSERIAFQSNRSGFSEIWTCASDGSHCVPVTKFNKRQITGTPRWSTDGKRLAFDSAPRVLHIYVTDADGASLRRLTSGAGNHVIPSWPQGGKSIYYGSDETGRLEIWRIPSAGGSAIQVTRAGGQTVFEAADGKFLYYTKKDSDPRLFRSATDGSGEIEILSGVVNRGFVVRADSIYYLRNEAPGRFMVRRFDLASRQDSQVAAVGRPMYWG